MNKLLLTNVIWMGVLALSGCSNQMITDDPSEEATPVRDSTSLTTRAGKLSTYTAPTYADDYSSIADWSQRSNWNLANVHDPSVMKADDGYY